MKNACASLLLIVFIICSSCKQKIKTNSVISKDSIQNNIELKENGLHVSRAFLTTAGGSPINNSNKVAVGERVCLRLAVSGWKDKKGYVLLDASENVTTGSGKFLTGSSSIFSRDYPNGIDLQSANHILLYQTIGRLDNPSDDIVISFKIWDKISNKSCLGSFKLYL